MADVKHTVVRTDNVWGTDQRVGLRSCRFYSDGDSTQADVDNGRICELVKLEDNEREVYKVKYAASDSDLTKCVLLDTPEIMADERLKNLDQFYNEAGDAIRGYLLHAGMFFSLTAEGFETVPTANQKISIGTDGKLKGDESGTFGTCVRIEDAGFYKYYVIEVAATEAKAAAPVI